MRLQTLLASLTVCALVAVPSVASGASPSTLAKTVAEAPTKTVAEVPTTLAAGSVVRVNQVGYLPNGPKRASIVSASTSPLEWELRNSSGAVVLRGRTTVIGPDAASGDNVHHADFSSYGKTGKGYVLAVGADVSHPFEISSSIYSRLASDAWAFFYHQRAGTPILARYVGDAYARPAGHLSVAPNTGDLSVPCVVDCGYRLDVPHGWYDAGDHGKYVVNGGVSVWHFLLLYERNKRAFTDGQSRIPERRNGVPDILDEARWELEFFLEMQAPSGMVHHKLHDDAWTGFPMSPSQDPQQRQLHAPSTAATLNLAATGAECARIWRSIDRSFAARCLAASEKAWRAAVANPAVYAPDSDNQGGGAYGDTNVSDEFYWAASELFLTTGRSEYRSFVVASPHYRASKLDGYYWGGVAAMADISLLYVRRPGIDLAPVRSRLVQTASEYAAAVRTQGYPNSAGYFWGSSSATLANSLIMLVARDITGDSRYRTLALEQMDYLLGRNALDRSYVTGYGSNDAHHQHHRFWAHAVDPAYPNPPAGSLAGGPNPGLQDPIAQEQLADCPPTPQRCYVDNIHSYSTNEVAINWNAPLGWVASALAQ